MIPFIKKQNSRLNLPLRGNAKFHYGAKKSLGQNFLTSHAVARDIVAAAELTAHDTVLEIGPGKGFLTEHLLKRAGQVIAVEKDDRMIEYLSQNFSQEIKSGKLKLVHGDALSLNLHHCGLAANSYKLAANIPYYITGEILRVFLSGNTQPSLMVLMVQKEVADRIVARDGKESILSMSVKVYGTPRYIQKVPARYFSPKPNVDSAVLLIENIAKTSFKKSGTEEKFFRILKTGFAHKRKKVSGNLKPFWGTKTPSMLSGCDIPPMARAENLSLKQWLCLAEK